MNCDEISYPVQVNIQDLAYYISRNMTYSDIAEFMLSIDHYISDKELTETLHRVLSESLDDWNGV